MHARIHLSLYTQLENLPEGLIGEILDGQIHTQPRPAWPHAVAASSLIDELLSPFQKGRGGPGGWWIVAEPELHLIRDTEVCVPDLAGWRRERMPNPPPGHRIEVVPDWIFEILSPSTASKDRQIKMPIYARYGVAHAWLIDPSIRTLETYTLDAGQWRGTRRFTDNDQVSAAPFHAVTIALADLWVPSAGS